MRKNLPFLILLCSFNFTYAQNDGWVIDAGVISSLEYYGVTLANGMLGVVTSPQPFKVKEIVINGTYDSYGRGRVPNLMKTFDFINLDMEVDHLWLGKNEISDFRQSLDIRNATLNASFDHGKKASVSYSLCALRHLPHSVLLSVTIDALQDVEVTFYSNIVSPDIIRDGQNSFNIIDRPHALIPMISSVGKSPSGKHLLAASAAFLFEESRAESPSVIYEEWDYNSHKMKFSKKIKKGTRYTFSIVGSSISSQHVADPLNEAERLTLFAVLEGARRLQIKHSEEWAKLWTGDVVIEGDASSQLAMRLGLYHLYSFVRKESAYSISPMGLSGLGYNGHVFWDTEVWMFPVLVLLQPDLARSLLEFRFNRLEEAKRNAMRHGFDGAMFPWESDDNGQESTPVWALAGPFQHHITADVGFAFWKYYQVTRDKEWLRTRGYPMLKEVADFWVSRVDEGDDGAYHIRNVVAADEFAENVDDNAYTNAAAKLVLGYANEAANVLGLPTNRKWAEISEKLVILQFPDGVTREHSTYNGETIKQCDANLLSYPLGLIRDEQRIKKDLVYYQDRLHPYGPAMSQSILALLHARLGNPEEAYQLFRTAIEKNELKPFGVLAETWGGTNPYFVTGAGGFLQTVMNGFGGLEITNKGVEQRTTALPEAWKSLTLKGIGVQRRSYVVKRK